jgi:Glycosyl hydrolase family 12
MQRARPGRQTSGPISLLSIGILTLAACSQGPDASSGAGGSESGGSGAGASGTGAGKGSGSAPASAQDAGGPSSGTASGSTPGGSGNANASGGSGGSAGSGASRGSASSGSAGNSCSIANAACMADNTGCNVGSYYLYDNQWNCGPTSGNHCGPESAYGCANADGTVSFVVTSSQPAGNTAVLTYPAVQSNFNATPALSSFRSITSSDTETSPHVGDYEVAYDCWFNNQANEVMVWVDNYNQVPAGKKVVAGVTVGGHSWDVWWVQSSGYLAFNVTSTLASGTVDLLALFKYAVTNAWLPANSTVGQLAFGIEVCSTGGNAATFTIDNYMLTSN